VHRPGKHHKAVVEFDTGKTQVLCWPGGLNQ
jgi:hypothetical protein